MIRASNRCGAGPPSGRAEVRPGSSGDPVEDQQYAAFNVTGCPDLLQPEGLRLVHRGFGQVHLQRDSGSTAGLQLDLDPSTRRTGRGAELVDQLPQRRDREDLA